MPAPGDQHKPSGTTTQNPFEEVKPHISEYTAQDIATLTARLNKRLGPEYIATRAGPGGARVAYLPAEKAINLANEVFGFNGWSSSIQNIQIDFVDENPTKGTISIGLSVVIRVTLKDGTYHEDVGYGGIENCKSKIAGFEKAKKEGTTDALKRALRNFGNVLGNCIYDKDYITKVSKVKAGTGKWDVGDLHRHADFAPKKEELEVKPQNINNLPQVAQLQQQQQQVPSLVAEESFDVNEFDEADFDDLGNPDEVLLPPDTVPQRRTEQIPPQQQNGRLPPHNQNHNQITPSKPPQSRPDQPQYNPHAQNNQNESRQPPHLRAQQQQQNQLPGLNDSDLNSRSSSPGLPSQHFAPPAPGSGPPNIQIGFFSAKAAEALDMNNNPIVSTAVQKFNPHAESPSIRKTTGVDHSTSAALNRKTLKVEPPLIREETPQPGAAVQALSSASRPVMKSTSSTGFSPVGGGRGAGGMTSAYRPPTRFGPNNTNNNNNVTANTGSNGNIPAPMNGTGQTGAASKAPERVLTAAKRPPLGDLSNVQNPNHGNATSFDGGGGGDAKRQRIGPGLSGHTTGIDGQNQNQSPAQPG